LAYSSTDETLTVLTVDFSVSRAMIAPLIPGSPSGPAWPASNPYWLEKIESHLRRAPYFGNGVIHGLQY
jgi:hypothetical protein